MPVEDRIDQLSRLALVIILILTLGLLSLPKSQTRKPQEIARKPEVSRMAAQPSQAADTRDGLATHPERRAKAI